MKIFCDCVYLVCRWTLIILGYIMLAVITVGVVSRYFFGRPLEWEYELCIAMFIWCTFLGAATAFRDKQHIAFSMIAEAIPALPKKIVLFLKNCVLLATLGAGVYFGWLVVDSTWFIQYQTLPISLALSYAALPVGFLVSLLFIVERMLAEGPCAV